MKEMIWDIAHLAHVELLTPRLEDGIAQFEKGAALLSIEHPSGEFTVNLNY